MHAPPKLKGIMRSIMVVLLLGAVGTGWSPALAQDVGSEADLLFRKGGESFKAGKYEDALLSFLASNRLARNRNALYNIASCYLRLADYSNAFRFFTEYQREKLSGPERQGVEDELSRLRARVALVSATSTPAGAVLYVDRKDLGARGTTPALLALPPGRHTLILELPGHHDEQRTVELELGRTVEVNLQHRLRLGALIINVKPAGAALRLNRDHGPVTALAPARLELKPGRHAVFISQPGYRSARTELELQAGEQLRVDAILDPLPPSPGKLVVKSNRPGALVSVDGRPAGVTPIAIEVSPGRHQVQVSSEDYAPFRTQVAVAAGQEQLVNAELSLGSEVEVAAASKMVQSVEEAAGSVTVLSGEEIRALGYRTIGEALRGVRGFYLSDDRQYQTVGVRGFNPPGDFNTRLLVLSDGHSLNDVWTGAAFVGHDFAADLGDVERIEVVRGPASALYGTGAFFGLIDVTTRAPEAQRFELALSGGSLGELRGRGSMFHDFGRRTTLRLSTSVLYSPRGASFVDPGGEGSIEDNDEERATTAQARLTVGDFSFTGRYNERRKKIPTAVYEIVPGTGRAAILDRRAFVEGRFERQLTRSVGLLVRTYYDHTDYHGRWPYSDEPREDVSDEGQADWMGAEARLLIQPRRWLKLVAGAEGLYAPVVSQAVTSGSAEAGSIEVLEQESFLASGSAYATGELILPHQLRLIAGIRADYFSSGGFSPSPSAAVIWQPYSRGSTKFFFGRAFRAASTYELSYHDGGVSQVPSADLGPETVLTWQLEHTHNLGSRFYVTGGVYYNDVHNLIRLGSAGASSIPCLAEGGCVQYQNSGHVGTVGAELELRRAFAGGSSFSLAYAFQRSRDLDAGPFAGEGATGIENSPEHLVYARMVQPLMRSYLNLGAELIYGSSRLRRDGGSTAHMVLGNLTLSGRSRFLHYALSCYNLLDWRYGVPVGSEYLREQLEVQQLGRTFLATLGATF